MTPVTSLLARHRETFERSPPAWFNPPADLATIFPEPITPGTVFSQDYATFEQLEGTIGGAAYGAFPDWAPGSITDIVIVLPRGKALLEMLVACCASALSPEGRLWVAGEIRHGIKSAARRLEGSFGVVQKVDSARHCALLCASMPTPTGAFDPADWRQDWPLAIGDQTLWVRSWPGVFNHGKLDHGTELLLQHVPDLPPTARVLDLGCGAGVIGATMLMKSPGVEMVLADTSALACQATHATLQANRLEGRVIASNGFSKLDGVFDLVATNPPFHRSHKSDPGMTPQLLAPARNFLAPGGQLLLVANRHLAYTTPLGDVFPDVSIIAQTPAFEVIRCRN